MYNADLTISAENLLQIDQKMNCISTKDLCTLKFRKVTR